jgi:hypothetical protein
LVEGGRLRRFIFLEDGSFDLFVLFNYFYFSDNLEKNSGREEEARAG